MTVEQDDRNELTDCEACAVGVQQTPCEACPRRWEAERRDRQFRRQMANERKDE